MHLVRNLHTGKLAHVVDQGRHRVTVRLPDGSEEEWLNEEADGGQVTLGCAEDFRAWFQLVRLGRPGPPSRRSY